MTQFRHIQTERHKEYISLVGEICRNEPLALRWFLQLLEVCLLWDHVADDDPIDKEKADVAFRAMTMDWVFNDWFIKHRLSLVPAFNAVVSEWKRSGPGSEASYLLYTQIPAVLALLLHGEAGEKFMPAIYENVRRERFEDIRRDHPMFFIVGLPRSRSAWFSAFMTDGPVACHHELIRDCELPDEYPDRLRATKAPIVGDANPMLPQFYARYKDQLPPHKIVFILRDPGEAREALKTMYEAHGIDPVPHLERWEIVTQAFNSMREKCPDAMTFQYNDLDKMATIREISEYCTGLPFNEERWYIFNQAKITAIPAKVAANQRLIK